MRRRKFITIVCGAAVAWPFAARAQQRAMPVIGFLNSASRAEWTLAAFKKGLSETGYVEGQNVAIEYRWAEGQNDRLPALAADLVRGQVTVIAANSAAAVAAKAATNRIPIVFNSGVDPVKIGLVASLNRPGGNLTGVSSLNVELGPKRLELLRELVPAATNIALLVNPTGPNAEILTSDVQRAARTLGLQIHVLHASTERAFDAAFASLVQMRADALVIGADGFFTSRSEQLAALAVRHAVPAIYQNRAFAAAGGLLSYGGSSADSYRLVGIYVGRILKGEKPGDLPVQQSTKVELTLNLNAAKTLGISISRELLARADEVIE